MLSTSPQQQRRARSQVPRKISKGGKKEIPSSLVRGCRKAAAATIDPQGSVISKSNSEETNSVKQQTGFTLFNCWNLLKKTLFKKRSVQTASHDSEFDDLDNPVYRRPSKSLEHLVSITRFSRAELKRLYRGFKAECPTGLVKEETFRSMYTQFFPKGASNTSQYPKYVFNSLAQDNSGLLGFEDLVLALSDLCRGTADEKLRWAFHIYDVDGDGVISRTELEDVVTSISELTGDTDVILESTAVQIWIERVFEKMDLDGDGVISREEFFTACLQDEQIRRSLSIFDDIVV